MKLLSGTCALILLASAHAVAAPLDDLLDGVALAPDALRADIETLTGATGDPPILSRSIHHADLGRAEDWLIARLEAIDGLTVSTELVSVTVELDGETTDVDGLRNIVAEIPGPDAPMLVLGAHLDSTAKASPEGWDARVDPAPGADDDASGVASLLQVAQTLASWPGGFERPVRFVFFTAEEVGLLGSGQYVDGLVDGGADVHAMFQLDPVGFNGNFTDRLWFAWDARWPELRDAADVAAADTDTWLTVQGVDAALIGGDDRSDHFHFWEAGWPALHFGAFPPPPDYHKTSDTLAVVDIDFLAEVTRVITALSAAQAGPLAPPDPPPESGCACSSGPVSSAPRSLVLAAALAWVLRRRRQCG